MTTAAEQMIAEHRRWYREAIEEIDRRLGELDAREKAVLEHERWITEKRSRIEKAIANA
jgi:hypothetical protein